MLKFPKPPAEITQIRGYAKFAPAHDVRAWAYTTFIEDGAPLYNPDHEHLQLATVLFVWSSVNFKRSGQQVVGTAQMGHQQGALGKKELLEGIYSEFNGGTLPDFIITICAPYAVEADPSAICAVVEHELYHCAHKRDQWGHKEYDRDGLPRLALRGHDIEEFSGVVRRYGAWNDGLKEFQSSLEAGPTISPVRAYNAVCGCGARV